MMEPRTYFELKRDAVYRYILWQTTLGNQQNLYLAEFPKSGGTWLAQMLAGLLSLPFPRNNSVSRQPCILHGHHQIRPKNKRVIHLTRDGRDVMVSAYYYFLINEKNIFQNIWVKKMNKEDLNDVKSNLPQFIDIFFNNYKSGGTRKNWNDFVLHYLEMKNVIQVRYEELNLHTSRTMSSLLHKLEIKTPSLPMEEVIERYSFKAQTGREKGQLDENSFLRRGNVGDWKNYFSRDAAEVFNFYAGEALISAGYEKTRNWNH